MALPVKTDSGTRVSAPPVASDINILLVDDESRNLDALESFLESPDYNLVRVLSGEDALLRLLNGEYAVIVLDVQMPGMSGIELANIIKQRKRTQHIPIIFLTAYFQEDKDVMQGYSIGAVDYLTKPLNPQILKSKINVFVDLYRKTRALAGANAALEAEVVQRQRAEEALRMVNNDLEARVNARTSDLIRVNEELRERETALRASEANAKAASKAKDDFLATLSHELRTPLNPVLLLATDAASNTQIPKEIRADFETIAKNIALEARLIDDMLDLTRITRGKVALEMQAIDVHAAVRDALEMARDEIDRKKITVVLNLLAAHCVALGDDVRLKQVFWNVIKNAGKFTDQGGAISIESSSTVSGDELTVKISDSGIGMNSDELGRIFEAFFQGDHATNVSPHRFGGIGLGLAISRKMVQLHSGSILAFSEGRGRGTTMVIKLPLVNAKCETPGVDEKSRQIPIEFADGEGRHREGRILLVEDHVPTANALMHLLGKRKFVVLSATSVAEARNLANRESFDLLISDIGLPDGTGYDLIGELRKSQKVVGIALTGYGMEDDIKRSREAGFAAHLTKPISVQALESALAAVWRRSNN